ncbi:MAG: phenylalanine--tRNA ligase beta subunit-related protein [Patescibacteria group bacterium]
MQNNLKNPNLCPAFYARKINGIKMVSTPVWMRNILEKHEINTVNILVDITNYVMIEL